MREVQTVYRPLAAAAAAGGAPLPPPGGSAGRPGSSRAGGSAPIVSNLPLSRGGHARGADGSSRPFFSKASGWGWGGVGGQLQG